MISTRQRYEIARIEALSLDLIAEKHAKLKLALETDLLRQQVEDARDNMRMAYSVLCGVIAGALASVLLQ